MMIIAEIAQAHDGSLGAAHAYIDAVANTGADAVKFQTHIAAAESTPAEPWRVRFSPQDETRYDYWKRMEFSEEQWAGLKQHAEERNLLFLSSPFSVEAAELLERLGIEMWKIASGEITNPLLLDVVLATGKPVLLSTGMSPWKEIDRAVERLAPIRDRLTLFQCTTAYPCSPERVGLNILQEMRDRYGCAVGLSDHSGTIYPGLAAAALGADAVEVHVTFSRECFGPDVAASITSSELKQLVEGVRFIDRALQSPLDKNKEAAGLSSLRSTFMKGVYVKRAVKAGTTFGINDLVLKKPQVGLPAERVTEVVGRKSRRDIPEGDAVLEEDLNSE